MFNKLTTLSDNVSNFKKQMQEAARSEVRPALQEVAQVLLEKIPNITHMTWTQYAPHFNDGEPCVFHVHEPEFGFGSDSETFHVSQDWQTKQLYLYSYEVDEETAPKLTQEQLELLENVSDSIQNLEEIMEEAFGSDARVNFNLKSGEIETDYCEHD